jgi:LysR family transcriptional regulator, regulator for bpeEF and oprC
MTGIAGAHALIAFSEVARRQSFAAAARELGQAPSTLAKAVGRLEASLGVRLFHRTTRKVNLTEDGERLFARCQRVLGELQELQEEADGRRATPSGTLRLDLPIAYGRRKLLPVLASLVRKHPGITLDVHLSDAYADLVQGGLDAAVRVGKLEDSGLVARRFAKQSMLLCAAPSYLQRVGRPRRFDDLARHRFIVYRQHSSGRDRPLQFVVKGKAMTLHPEHTVRINDGEAMARAAAMGLGLTQLPDYMVEDELASGALVEVLPSLRPPDIPIHLVMPTQRLMPARVRALLDELALAYDPK